MDMFWHGHISINTHGEAASHVFQTLNQQVVNVRRGEVSLPAVTTESNEVRLSGLLETSQAARHEESLHRSYEKVSDTQVSAQPRGANLGHQASLSGWLSWCPLQTP